MLKNLYRLFNMKSIKKTLMVITFFFIFLIIIIYQLYNVLFERYKNLQQVRQQPSTEQYFGTPMRHIPYNMIKKEIYKHDEDFSIEIEESRQAQMIATPGCSIPLAMVDYRENMTKTKKMGCGTRIIYMKRYQNDYVQATINVIKMKKQIKMGDNYECCYKFFQWSKSPGHEDLDVQYTPCNNFMNGDIIKLENDFLNVQCFEYNNNYRHLIYEDDYAFCRKINRTYNGTKTNSDRYNVLIIGMDSMSLPRLAQTMPRTIMFFKHHNWLGYRGFHKVGDNTLANLLPALTGKLSSDIIKKCFRRMDQCNDYFLWNIFKKNGYITAFGEDYLHLPDTFSKDFVFHKAPTDHYMRPFFKNKEQDVNNHSIICSGKKRSGEQMLDYALDFALTYRNDPFFGFFWINSFSHNIYNHPQDADLLFENFFNRIIYTGVLDNTFIIFMSDHGVRFGKHRLQMESYYDNRMPLLFLWAPRTFKINYPEKLKGLVINQFRLITPYDLFDTLNEINVLGIGDLYNNTIKYESLFGRQSLFKIVSANRTCYDVGIYEKWCSCHRLYPLDKEDPEAVRSVQFVASYIKKTLKNIETKRCMNCSNLSIQNISRIHFYYSSDKTNLYYVLAFSMSPKNVFYEAIVSRNDTTLDLVGKVDIISQYRGFGDCTIKRSDKIFCICQKINNCKTT